MVNSAPRLTIIDVNFPDRNGHLYRLVTLYVTLVLNPNCVAQAKGNARSDRPGCDVREALLQFEKRPL